MKKRIISAIIALGIIVIPLIVLGGVYFALGMTTIALLAYKELSKLKREDRKVPLLVKIIGGVILSIMVFNSYFITSLNMIIDYKIIAALFLVLLIPVIFYNDKEKYNSNDAMFLIGGILLIGVAFSLSIYLRNYAIKYLIMFILITVLNDTFAQMFGGLIGKHKMIPTISPLKTWEGAIMGSLISTFVATTYYLTLINPDASILVVTLCILFLSFMGQLGDLLFSAIKRLYNIKDFSNIMPGHGGILDRLDSLIFVLIAFMLLINII